MPKFATLAFLVQHIAQERLPPPAGDPLRGTNAYDRVRLRPLPRFDLVRRI